MAHEREHPHARPDVEGALTCQVLTANLSLPTSSAVPLNMVLALWRSSAYKRELVRSKLGRNAWDIQNTICGIQTRMQFNALLAAWSRGAHVWAFSEVAGGWCLLSCALLIIHSGSWELHWPTQMGMRVWASTRIPPTTGVEPMLGSPNTHSDLDARVAQVAS